MIRQTWLLLGLVSLGAIAPFALAFTGSPANACTPNPNFPHGCDRYNTPRLNVPVVKGGGDGDPWPPNCPQCGIRFDPKQEVSLPASDLQYRGSFGYLNPQPLPPKAGQILR
jgi:hypothetical protein